MILFSDWKWEQCWQIDEADLQFYEWDFWRVQDSGCTGHTVSYTEQLGAQSEDKIGKINL